MESIPGFVSIPRLAGLSRPAGAFFFATVLGPGGPGQWRVSLDGKPATVATTLDLTPGQVLKLKVVSQTKGQWLFQLMGSPAASASLEQRPANEFGSLAAAFFSRGLPAAEERLQLWSRWMASGGPKPLDKDTWAASLEARGEGPHGALAGEIEPWLNWQAALEKGQTPDPPRDEHCWDKWNLRNTADGAPWLVMPLRWEYSGQVDAGLLQARWNPQGLFIDRWVVTAAPASTPFRMEASARPGRLDLVWKFFRPEQGLSWKALVTGPGFPNLSSPDLSVSLTVTGIGTDPPAFSRGGIDVQA